MSSWYVYVTRPAACSALSAVSMTPSHGSSILDEYAATTVSGAADGSWATATGAAARAQRPMTASVVDRARRRRVMTAPLPLGRRTVPPRRVHPDLAIVVGTGGGVKSSVQDGRTSRDPYPACESPSTGRHPSNGGGAGLTPVQPIADAAVATERAPSEASER